MCEEGCAGVLPARCCSSWLTAAAGGATASLPGGTRGSVEGRGVLASGIVGGVDDVSGDKYV